MSMSRIPSALMSPGPTPDPRLSLAGPRHGPGVVRGGGAVALGVRRGGALVDPVGQRGLPEIAGRLSRRDPPRGGEVRPSDQEVVAPIAVDVPRGERGADRVARVGA